MTQSCQTRRIFLLRALSTMGGIIGLSACQQTTTPVQMAQFILKISNPDGWVEGLVNCESNA